MTVEVVNKDPMTTRYLTRVRRLRTHAWTHLGSEQTVFITLPSPIAHKMDRPQSWKSRTQGSFPLALELCRCDLYLTSSHSVLTFISCHSAHYSPLTTFTMRVPVEYITLAISGLGALNPSESAESAVASKCWTSSQSVGAHWGPLNDLYAPCL